MQKYSLSSCKPPLVGVLYEAFASLLIKRMRGAKLRITHTKSKEKQPQKPGPLLFAQ